eukprot:scaffold1566_cov150-Skeletonema_menzelii.AAC.2
MEGDHRVGSRELQFGIRIPCSEKFGCLGHGHGDGEDIFRAMGCSLALGRCESGVGGRCFEVVNLPKEVLEMR